MTHRQPLPAEDIHPTPATPCRGTELPSWRDLTDSLRRPYRVTLPMVLLVCLVPGYLVIAAAVEDRTLHTPAVGLDHLLPLVPAWSLVYGALYAFLIILPVFVVRREALIRRTVSAYLLVWITSFLVFWLYPTAAPRAESFAGDGFAAWGLGFLYDADPPYNCFPSIHVAHSFVSAFACSRVHTTLGRVATVAAGLVALSTLLTKQHYVLDVAAGAALAGIAWLIFLRGYPRNAVPAAERRLAPGFALLTAGLVLLGMAIFGVAYALAPA